MGIFYLIINIIGYFSKFIYMQEYESKNDDIGYFIYMKKNESRNSGIDIE